MVTLVSLTRLHLACKYSYKMSVHYPRGIYPDFNMSFTLMDIYGIHFPHVGCQGNNVGPIFLSVCWLLVSNHYGKRTFGEKDWRLWNAGGVSMLGHFHNTWTPVVILFDLVIWNTPGEGTNTWISWMLQVCKAYWCHEWMCIQKPEELNGSVTEGCVFFKELPIKRGGSPASHTLILFLT